MRPTNYEELCDQALDQLEDAAAILEERARDLRKFAVEFENGAQSPEQMDSAAAGVTGDYEDHLVPAIRDIYSEYPHIRTAPGEGYW